MIGFTVLFGQLSLKMFLYPSPEWKFSVKLFLFIQSVPFILIVRLLLKGTDTGVVTGHPLN